MSAIIGLDVLDLQEAVKQRLDTDEWFNLIPVITQSLHDLSSVYQEQISKLGICCVVMTPIINCTRPDEPSCVADEIPVQIIVSEDMQFNQTGKRALQTAQVIAALLHHWVPDSASLYSTWDGPDANPAFVFHVSTPTIVLLDDPLFTSYAVNMKTKGVFAYEWTAGTKATQKIIGNTGIM